ncbi:MAG: ATP phosphoribosyltransferase regulatory subunit [Pseudomonadota bacterium]
MLQTITSYLESTGCTFPEIGLLQPADPFLDTTGEDLRRRIFITQENSGAMLCLRPEFTVPVCLAHLQNSNPAARYAYGGSVFRQRSDEASEFIQAGYEDLGNSDTASADVECINTALGVMEACNKSGANLVLGDQSIFMKLLDALEIPDAWRKKLGRAFGDTELLRAQLDAMSQDNGAELQGLPRGVLAAIATQNQPKVIDEIAQLMAADGLPLTGGRTPKAVAERVLEKVVLGANSLEKDKREALEAFLEIDVILSKASDAIAEFEQEFGLSLNGASENIAALCKGIGEQAEKTSYRARFGRRLDYYTGLVFEIYGQDSDKPLIGGGRYDRLLTLLGSETEIPAVGFAIWVDRLGEVS